MTDTDLIKVYETAYQEEFGKYSALTQQFNDKARDKEYAEKLGLTLVAMLTTFQRSKLNSDIIDHHEHIYKLGGYVVDVIRAIPDIAKSHKILTDRWHEENKHGASVEFKKFLGIPYGIKKVTLKPAIRMGSPFEDLTDEKEIATEFGKLKASFDIREEIKKKLISMGLIDLETPGISPDLHNKLKLALKNDDLDGFFRALQSLFASLPYNMKITEGYFHSHIHIVLTMIGTKIRSEEETNIGRIDSIVETDKCLYIIEFKLASSSVALEQIKAKRYYQKYYTSPKEIILVGVSLNREEKNINDWKVLRLADIML